MSIKTIKISITWTKIVLLLYSLFFYLLKFVYSIIYLTFRNRIRFTFKQFEQNLIDTINKNGVVSRKLKELIIIIN